MEINSQELPQWYRLSFKFKWEAPRYLELMTLDLLVIPAIEEFKLNLGLWTFHRSADQADSDGRMLKFNVFTDKGTADKIFAFIKAPRDRGQIEYYLEVGYPDLSKFGSQIEEVAPESTLELKKAWPYFMKGVCEMFIHLLEESKKISNGDYSKLQDSLEALFRSHYQHSFVHFVWLAFGYSKPFDLLLLEEPVSSKQRCKHGNQEVDCWKVEGLNSI